MVEMVPEHTNTPLFRHGLWPLPLAGGIEEDAYIYIYIYIQWCYNSFWFLHAVHIVNVFLKPLSP
jgi:hypothetical protein